VAHALGVSRDAAVVPLLAEMAGDIPLHTLEVLRFLHRRGILRRTTDGGWEITDENPPLPPGVPELIRARVQRLPLGEREVLETVAVLGEQTSGDLVVAAMGTGVMGALEMLVRHGFLLRQEGGYRFSHVLVWRAVYDGIAPSSRQALHARVAALLQQRSSASPGQVAWHLVHAGQHRMAVGAYLAAAREALTLFAREQAIAHCQAGLDLVQVDSVDATVCDLLLVRAEAAAPLGRVAGARRDLARAIHLARSLRDGRRLARACQLAGHLAYRQGRFAQARFFLTHGYALYRGQGEMGGAAEALSMLTDVALSSGNLAQAREHALAAQALYAQTGSLQGQAHAAYRLGMVEMERGEVEAATQVLQRAVTLARRAQSLHLEGAALNGLGILALNQRDPREALRIYPDVLRIAESLGDRHNRTTTLHNLAVAAMTAGRFDEALARCGDVLAAARESGNRRMRLLAALLQGSIYTSCGQFHEAEDVLCHGLGEAEEMGYAPGVAYARRNLGILARERGDLAQAVAEGQASVDQMKGLGLRRNLDVSVFELAHSALLAGDPERALAALKEILMQALPPTMRALLEALLADALAALGQVDEARQVMADVLRVLARLSEDEYLPAAWHAVARAMNHWDAGGARQALAQAYLALQTQCLQVPEAWRSAFLEQVYSHRVIARSWLAAAPRPVERLRVTLPRLDNKGMRVVLWTLDMGDEDALVEARAGAIALRRHRLARLLREAEEQGARATHAALAEALGVSVPTVRRDMAALQEGPPNQ